MKSVAVIVNGDEKSILASRANGLFTPLRNDFATKIFCRHGNRAKAFITFILQVAKNKPDFIYLIDTSIPGAFAVIFCRLLMRTRFAVDTGDLAYELAKSTGRVGKLGLTLIRVAELWSLRLADFVVVRGTYHREILQKIIAAPIFLIRDSTWTKPPGVETSNELKESIGLSGKFIVGIVGTVRFAPKIGICYGWDLVEAFQYLPHHMDAVGLIIGDGDGVEILKKRAEEIGVADKIMFLGRVSYEKLHEYIKVFDVALSTQTNNVVGSVRTTGKLVEYMACERFVLASDVGEARLLLPDIMRVEYDGLKDSEYPKRLAKRIISLYYDRLLVEEAGRENGKRARELLDYGVASKKLMDCLNWYFAKDEDARRARPL